MNIYFDNKDNLKNLILFGFLCGLFLWLNYIVAIVLLLFILFFYFTDKLFFTRKKFLIFLSSFFLGFLPRIIYEYSKIYTAEYIEMFGGKYIFIFNLDKLIYVKNKLIDFLLYRMPLSFSFKDFYFIKGTFFDYFYYFIFISVFIFFIFIYRKYLFKVLLSFIPLKRFNLDKNKNLKIIFLLMYIIIFVVIYIFSPLSVGKLNTGFFIGYRYLLPLHFVMLMLVSIFLAGLCQKRSHLFNINKKISISLLVVLSLFGILSLSLFANSDITYYSDYKPLYSSPFCDDYLCYMKGLYYGYTSNDPIEKCQNTTRKSFCFEALGRVFLRKNNYNFSMGKDYCNNIPLDFRNDCNMGLIKEIHEVKENESIFSYCDFFDESYKESCYQSLKEDPLEERKERLILYLGSYKCYEQDTIDHTRIFCPSYW